MRTKVVAIVALVIALGVAAAWKERQTVRDLKNQLRSAAADSAEKDKTIRAQGEELRRLLSQSGADHGATPEEDTEKVPAPIRSAAASRVDGGPSTVGLESINELLRRTMDDPQTAARRRQMLKADVKQAYGEFVRAQHLSSAQAEEFLELLTDREMIDLQDSTAFLAGDPDDSEGSSSTARRAAAAFAETDRQLRALLPESDYAQFQEYEKTISERVTLAEIRQELALNSQPLKDDQISYLSQVLADERLRTPAIGFDPRSAGHFRDKYSSATEGENEARYFEVQADLDQRVLVRAKAVLAPDQYEALATFQKQHAEVERSGIELARQVIARKKANAPAQ